MWRAALVGLLVTGAACGKKTDDGPAVVAGATAGTVVELEGTVTANGKPLAKGDVVAGDDLVETGEGARIAIELAHNHARWTLGAGKHEKPRDSKAWRMAKVEGSAAGVDQTATSAGRDGERRAAETDVTTSTGAKGSDASPASRGMGSSAPPPVAAAPASPPPAAASPPPAAPIAQGHASRPTASPKIGAPGGPPPDLQPLAGGGGKGDSKEDSKEEKMDRVMLPEPHARQIVQHDAELQKCVKPGTTAHLAITCTEKSCTLATKAAEAACLRARFGKLELPKADYAFELDLTGPAR